MYAGVGVFLCVPMYIHVCVCMCVCTLCGICMCDVCGVCVYVCVAAQDLCICVIYG